MTRDNMVRLSDEEMEALESLKSSMFSSDTPYGKVIGSIANQETLSEQKQILITGKGTPDQYANQNDTIRAPRANIICRPVGKNGENLRGFNADLIVLLTDVDKEIMENVIQPMRGQIIDLS